MSKKIEDSRFKEFIEDALLNSDVSLGDLVKTLDGHGFTVSKSLLGNHKRELIEQRDAKQFKEVVLPISGQMAALNEAYSLLIDIALSKTKAFHKDIGFLPDHVYKSVLDMQKIMKVQRERDLLE